ARMVDAFRQLIERSERTMRERLRALAKPGEYRFTDMIDSDGQGHGPIRMRYRLKVDHDRIVLDCSESDDQVPGPVNFLMAPQVPSTVFGLYLLGGDPENLLNDGAARVI